MKNKPFWSEGHLFQACRMLFLFASLIALSTSVGCRKQDVSLLAETTVRLDLQGGFYGSLDIPYNAMISYGTFDGDVNEISSEWFSRKAPEDNSILVIYSNQLSETNTTLCIFNSCHTKLILRLNNETNDIFHRVEINNCPTNTWMIEKGINNLSLSY